MVSNGKEERSQRRMDCVCVMSLLHSIVLLLLGGGSRNTYFMYVFQPTKKMSKKQKTTRKGGRKRMQKVYNKLFLITLLQSPQTPWSHPHSTPHPPTCPQQQS